jgi:hypothetical protein
MSDPEKLLLTAEAILAILVRHQVDAVVIGAVALAAHHYVRPRAVGARYRLEGLDELIAESRTV